MVLVAGALLLAGCGGDDESAEQRAEGPAPSAPSDRGDDAGEEEPPEPEGDVEVEPPNRDEGDDGAAGAGCVFEAPPGRLGEDAIEIELAGPSCEEAMRLAQAAAVGQPAGANLTVARDGYDCEPSTAEKGANVTYVCTGAGGKASFEVIWSAGGG